MRQVTAVDRWPSGMGWTVGALRGRPPQLAAHLGVAFETGIDNLGEFDLAAIEAPFGQYWLFQHRDAPGDGTDVIVDAAVSRDDALDAVARDLGIDCAELQRERMSWVNEHASAPELALLRGNSDEHEKPGAGDAPRPRHRGVA
ncbi:MAG: hypothetical protein IT303_02965 [Dehalococcoidia bacterium]|nr:hypothetical protein [Dehalococcoidia bacterium]